MDELDLIDKAKNDFKLSLSLLEKGDVRDAAEKAWMAIENIRKALLVAVKIPYEIAKTVVNGVPLFSKILKILGKKRTCLECTSILTAGLIHLVFYEMVIPDGELEEIIRNEVPQWIEEMINVINSVKHVDLSHLVEIIEKMNKIKAEILRKSREYLDLSEQLSKEIATVLVKRH